MGDELMMKIGPAGFVGQGSTSWDERGRNNIVQIFVSHEERKINSIQFQYVEEVGTRVMSQRRGCLSLSGCCKFDVVKLNLPTEHITWVSGHLNSYLHKTLCSITFGTNHGEYGPFGGFKPDDKVFCFNLGDDLERQFYGFHGTADSHCVQSIGVYLKPNITVDYPMMHITIDY